MIEITDVDDEFPQEKKYNSLMRKKERFSSQLSFTEKILRWDMKDEPYTVLKEILMAFAY